MFKSCPSCGELVHSSAPRCRHCGAVINRETYAAQGEQRPTIVIEKTAFPAEPEMRRVPARIIATHHTSDGQVVPPEYDEDFNPRAFCWPALFFGEFWYAEKGLRSSAITNFWLRLMTSIIGMLALVLLIYAGMSDASSESTDNTIAGVGVAMVVIWLAGLFASAAYGISQGQTAYRRYTMLYNAQLKSEYPNDARAEGIKLYWLLLYMPFAIYLLIFSIILATASTT